MTDFPIGARIKAVVTGVVASEPGRGKVLISHAFGDPHASYLHVPVDSVTQVVPPIQKPGAPIWHVKEEESFKVVLHDPEAGQYVVRNRDGALLVLDDDGDIMPEADAVALYSEAPEPPPEPEFTQAEPAPCASCGQTGGHLDNCIEKDPF